MAFRQLKTEAFLAAMSSGQSAIAMDSSTSKGFSVWVNKDLRNAEQTGDWSELMAKAEKQTKSFRNAFYKKGRAY
jgi:hypothetical protein